MVSSNSCPHWKGKFPNVTESCQCPSFLEFRMMYR
uniref:Uncharacterized protein n=1 Tax=Anguilla anguilla TaxID=7936 RepID=A0A0E9SZ82_ANGAN